MLWELGYGHLLQCQTVPQFEVTRDYCGLMARHCSRSTCSQPAAVTLTYQYGRALVWLDDLAVERDPHAYDLCLRHSQRFVVPTGWRLEDRRDRFTMVIPNRLAG